MGLSRTAKIALCLAAVVLTSPVWGFEVLYRALLPTNLPDLSVRSEASSTELDALWLASGEHPIASVTPLGVWNYFRSYNPGADPRAGTQASMLLAKNWVEQIWPRNARVGRLRHAATEAAVLVWLSRNATVDALKRSLAEKTYFGRHAYGIRAAKKAYYGCAASELSVAELALLVGLPQSPARFDPVAHPDHAAARRRYIVRQLTTAGLISEAEGAKAAEESAESKVVPKLEPCP